MSENVFKDITAMHAQYGHTKRMDKQFLGFRLWFLFEELLETIEAVESGSPEDVVDGLIDLLVVTVGTLDHSGIDMQRAWDTVLETNMQKTSGSNPTRPGSGGMDLVKPPGWKSPIHIGNVGGFYGATGPLASTAFPFHMLVMLRALKLCKIKTKIYDRGVKKAEYFPDGMDNLAYEIHKKGMRVKSLVRALKAGAPEPEETLEDSCMDQIVWHALMIEWYNWRMDGQGMEDYFNRLNPREV